MTSIPVIWPRAPEANSASSVSSTALSSPSASGDEAAHSFVGHGEFGGPPGAAVHPTITTTVANNIRLNMSGLLPATFDRTHGNTAARLQSSQHERTRSPVGHGRANQPPRLPERGGRLRRDDRRPVAVTRSRNAPRAGPGRRLSAGADRIARIARRIVRGVPLDAQ